MEDTINIVEYDQSWTEAFESEKKRFRDLVRSGSHRACGSTAIPGQASKPVIDILSA